MKQIRATGRHLASACIAFGILASGTAHAQLDLQSIGASLLGGGSSRRRPQGGVAQLLQAYVGANQQVLTGQSSLASAMGLTGAAGQAQQAASQLAGGNALTPAALSQMGGAQQSVSQALGAFASGGATHGPIDKQAFSNGLASLGQGPRSIRNCSRGRQSRFDERGVAVAVGPESAEHAGCVVYRAKRAGPVAVARDDAQPGRAVRDEPGHFGAVGRIVRAEAAAVTLRGAVRDAVPASRATRR